MDSTLCLPKAPYIFVAAVIALFLLASVTEPPSLQKLSSNLHIMKSHFHDTPSAEMNSTLGFEKIFAINMPERTDKRDMMTLAASLSNLSIDFAEGIKGETVPDKALPMHQEDRHMWESFIGSWRAHMNTLREVVEKGYSSVLILEDDADWDIRIKEQMTQFAAGARWLQDIEPNEKTHSPYGDDWDVLWLGHWIDGFGDLDVPTFVIENDESAPAYDDGAPNWIKQYPKHSRLIHPTVDMVGTLAYAVSRRGAERILYSLSVNGLVDNFDVALSEYCKWTPFEDTCITSNPSLFRQHRAAGAAGKNSDNIEGSQMVDEAQTVALQWPVKMNWEKLLKGQTDFVDQYPDPLEDQI